MKRRFAVIFATAVLSMGLLPATASAGLWCENADEVATEAGYACRTGLGTVITVCNKVAGVFGNECGLG